MSLRRSGRASKATGASPTPTSDTSALASTSNPTAGAAAAATGEEDATAATGAVETRGKRKRTTTSPTLVTSGSTSTRIKLTRGAATLVATQQAQAKQPASSASTAAGTGAGAGAAGETAETQKEKERKPRKRASGKRKWSNKRTKKSAPGSTSAGASAAGGANGVEEEEGEGEEGEEDVSAEMGDLSAEMNGEGTRARKIKGALDLLPGQLERENEEVVLDETLELWLEEQEREQLHVVMRAFMPALLEARLDSAEVNGTKAKASSSESFSTLAEALDGRPVKLRHLRTHLASLRKAQQVAMRSTSVSADEKTAQEALLRAHTLLITLIDSLASARRAADPSVLASTRATLEAQPDAKAEPEAEGETASGAGRGSATKRKVALHMMLPQGHYFTSAAEVDGARALDVGCADLVSVVAAPAGAKGKGQVPTLGERVYGGVAKSEKEVVRRKPEGELHRPATHLYYGPYASFAPTHDTQDATLSLGASRLLWENKRALRDTLRTRGWGADATLEEQIEEPEAAPAAASGGAEADAEEAVMEKSLTRADFEALHPDLDAAQLAAAYAALEQEAEVDVRLSQSAALLRALQGAQEERLRRGFGKDDSVVDTPDERERKLAEQVLHGLAELVKLRPKAVTLDAAGQASQLSLIPRASRLRAAAHSAAIDPALLSADTSSAVVDAGYWGTLDEASFGPDAQRRRKAVEEAAQAAVLASQHVGRPIASLGAVPTLAPPSVIVDNEVVRLVPAAQKRVKAALAQKGSLVGATSRGAKGDLLTRVAETRGYTPQHAHAVDVAFVRPIVASASGNAHVGTPTPGAPTTPAPQGQRASPVLQRGALPAQQQQQQQAEFAAQQAALHARQAALVRPLPQQQQHGHYPANMTPQASSSPSSSQQQQHRANGTPSGSQSYATAGAGPMRQTLGYYPNATPARPLPMAVVPQQQQQQSPAWRPPPPQAQQQQQQRTYAQFVPPAAQAHSVPYALYQQQQQQMAQAQAQQQQQGGVAMGMHLPQHPQHGLWVQQQMQAAYAQQQQQQQQAARR